MNNVYILARALGGQMLRHRRKAATKQMPARRRARSGCSKMQTLFID
jgi:hypothetical protein